MTSTRELLEKGVVFRTQSRRVSMIEAVVNTLFGLTIQVIAQWLMFLALHIHTTASQFWSFTMTMTILSVARGFLIRRLFNTEFWRRWTWGKPRRLDKPINPFSATGG